MAVARSKKPKQAPWTRSPTRRQEILDSAQALFATRGFRSTTLIDISEDLGVAKATLFHYFRTKEQILFELYQQAMGLALTRLAAADNEDGEPEAVLLALVREHALVILQNKALFTILFSEEGGLQADHLAQIQDQQRQYFGRLARPIAQLADAGRLRVEAPAWIIARTMLGAGSWTHRWVESDGDLGYEQIATTIAQLMLGGLLAAG